MSYHQKLSLFFLRISIGLLLFYAGISKLLNPNWTSAGYLKTAQTLSPFYNWLATSHNIGWVNFLNEWGLILIGISLILGIFVRIASVPGMVLMVLYYIPILHFPYVGKNPASLLVDEHVLIIAGLLVLLAFDAGRFWGLEKRIFKFIKSK
ncbi:DoxX family membrane protein [Candidatus Microgenomates bacterium]|nr:MAG: DoxX family membrane protein [Candidatus Microgenomates bacterium]